MKYLVYDYGLYVEHANALWQKEGDEVLYFTPWASAFPNFVNYAIGKNFEHITKVLFFWQYVEQADCIVNFDVHGNDMVAYLKEKYPHKSIYGSGKGEMLEDDRWGLKQIMKKIGLSVQKSVKIQGLTNLRNYLKDNPKKVVKLSIFRGDIETFPAIDYKHVEFLLGDIERSFHPFEEDYIFIVEEMLDSKVETGVDLFFNGINYITPYLYGYEWKKGLYVGKFSEVLPYPLKVTMDKLQPVLQEADWRGAISTEEMIMQNGEHYLLDICSRLPSPLSSLYPVYIKNWSDLVYKIGKKEDIKIETDVKYVAAFPISSEHAEANYVELFVDKKWQKNIQYRMVCGHYDRVYAVKGMSGVVVLVAGGDSVDEVLNKLKEAANHVDAFALETDAVAGVETVKEIIEAGKRVGVDF